MKPERKNRRSYAEPDYIYGFCAFGAVNHLELNFFTLGQGAVSITDNVFVVDKNVRSRLVLDKAPT